MEDILVDYCKLVYAFRIDLYLLRLVNLDVFLELGHRATPVD
jgi:hypothetical protein